MRIKCPAGAIPSSIKVDVSHLNVDEGVYVRDLSLPAGVTVDAEGDLLIVHVVMRGDAAEPTAEAAAAEAVHPARSDQARAQGKRESGLTDELVLPLGREHPIAASRGVGNGYLQPRATPWRR